MMRTYKFRIYPSKRLQETIEEHLNICRYLYNYLLEQKTKNPKLNKGDTQKLITLHKKENPELKKVHSKVLQIINNKLWGSLKALGKLKQNGHKVGRLRFKSSKNHYKTIEYNQSGFKVDYTTKRLKLSKIGEIPITLHRKIKGVIKGIIIKKEPTGKWFAFFQVEEEPKPLPKTNKVIGIDLGINGYAIDSEGNKFENPKFIDKTFDKIKKVQKNLSRKVRGSNNYKKTKLKLINVYDKLNNQKNDFLHKLSRYYINNYDKIVLEDLKIKSMIENKKGQKTLNRHILDGSWRKFINLLLYKAEGAGREVILINPAYTSKKCSNCGFVVSSLKLSDRLFFCPNCGWNIDRDYNASLNILKSGLGGSVVPVEGRPLLRIIPYIKVISGQVSPMSQGAPSVREG
ncbi:RNA-guided endonuclease InsQ/TnpB family protein [Methanococcus aeolicus]|uniref:RNA-guided endonuclease InsQ/TnpB family protein n=1 Tax=Methanococcus aeolicus TaxID=42879 RepID=UPI0021C70EA3|nr:transposase [Methanococcus aeolicus]UXM85062.1 transposase [Methanococcus aeolicus]